VRGRGYIRVATALLTVAVAGVLAGVALAAGSPLRNRYYDGSAATTAGGISLALDFQIAGSGHRVRRLNVTFLSFTCPGGTSADLLLPDNTAAAITAAHTFRITLPSKDSFSPNPPNGHLTLSGTFAGATVSGRLVFTGRGPLAGCHKTIHWDGRVRPLVDRFAGIVVQGSHHASISFYRTIEPHRHVTDFAAGALTLTCPGGGTDHRSFMSVDSLRVRANGMFGGDLFFTNGEAGAMSGAFRSVTRAVGSVSYSGRDDCGYSSLHWSAHRVAARVLGPLNFG